MHVVYPAELVFVIKFIAVETRVFKENARLRLNPEAVKRPQSTLMNRNV